MKIPLVICATFLLISPLIQEPVSARSVKTYRAETAVPIRENDIALAKSDAFLTLQRLLISVAIQDLIGRNLYREYQARIFRRESFKPSNYLISVKILREFSNGRNYSMKIKGKVQTSLLADSLKKMGMILRTDPWLSVTLVIEEGAGIDRRDLESRLKLFHVKITSVGKVSPRTVSWNAVDQKSEIKSLFMNFPKNQVIYYIGIKPSDGHSNERISVRLFKGSSYEKLSDFSLTLPERWPLTNLKNERLKYISKLQLLFSLDSLKLDSYETGDESIMRLEVNGLANPYQRWVFENKVLGASRRIRSSVLTRFDSKTVEYEVRLKSSASSFSTLFTQKSPFFYFVVERRDDSSMAVSCFFKRDDTVYDIIEWQPRESIIKMIQEAVQEENITASNKKHGSPIPDRVNEAYFPLFTEKEPNNTSSVYDDLPPATLIVGNLSSRADEDIFQLRRQIKSKIVTIDWMKIGKTALSPQLKLYDENFNFLCTYRLTGSQQKIRIRHTFKSGDVPRKMYLRITDKVGFIQGETGGFKSFYYLLKYRWRARE